MEYTFDDTLEDFLEGHLSFSEADERLKVTELNSQQAETWRSFGKLEQGLTERIAAGAELPWLVTKVMAKVDACQKAKEWLKIQKPEVVGSVGTQFRYFLTPFLLKILGAGVVGACTGHLLGSSLGVLQQYQALLPAGMTFSLVFAAAIGALSTLAVITPTLKKYYY